MAPKSKADWKPVASDGEAKPVSDDKRGSKGGKGKGGGGARKGGKADGGDDRWHEGGKGGWNGGTRSRGGGYNAGGDDDYYEGYGYGGADAYGSNNFSYAAPWHAQENVAPAPPPPKSIWTEYTAPDGTPYYYNCRTGLTQWDRPAALDAPKPSEKSDDKAEGEFAGKGSRRSRPDVDGDDRRGEGRSKGDRGGDRRGGDGDGDRSKGAKGNNRGKRDGGRGSTSGDKPKGGGGRGGGTTQTDPSDFGPPGCNLFVFHLPDDWNDEDLNEYFAPHGKVVSAKVMKELGTGRSRGFGFVSYEDRVSAATAIKKMQGYKILGKRLKVEFKKGEGQDGLLDGLDSNEGDDGGGKKSYPDDDRLIGYLRAISAKNVVQSLKESEGAEDDGDDAGADYGRHADEADMDHLPTDD